MTGQWKAVWSYTSTHLGAGIIAAVLGLVVLVMVCRGVRRMSRALCRPVARAARGKGTEDVLTFAVAGIATAFSAQGMWRFFDHKLHIHEDALRALMFAVFELAMFVSAIRARRRVLDETIGSAGVDGGAVWGMAALSGVLSATDAWPSFGGVLARLAAPLVAAWLWERGMAIERKKAGRSTIHWRITPERMLVRLGVAEPTDRTATEVDAHRRMTRVALAAHRVRSLTASGTKGWRLRRANWRLTRAMRGAVEYTGLAGDPDQQTALIDQLGALYNAQALTKLSPTAPWNRSVPPVRFMLTPVAFPPRPSIPELGAAPDTRSGPNGSDRTDGVSAGPEAGSPRPDSASVEESPATSADTRADKSTASRHVDREAFLEALTSMNGHVERARSQMKAAGLTPPGKSYAYELRNLWREENTGRLTRIK